MQHPVQRHQTALRQSRSRATKADSSATKQNLLQQRLIALQLKQIPPLQKQNPLQRQQVHLRLMQK